MQKVRLTLAGVLPALVLLFGIQLSARAAHTPPLRDTQPWLTDVDTFNNHIWHQIDTLYSGDTYTLAKIGDGSRSNSNSRQLSFADRVVYQRAIEEVYWRHRIWPKQRPDLKPSLDAVMSQAAIEQKVQDYLRNSELLGQSWQKLITPEQLQTEMERMAQDTKQPEVLRELFAALDNNPLVIAECLARPVLAQRLISELKNEERVQLTTVAWLNQPLRSWLANSETQGPMTMAAVNVNHTLPAISNGTSDCIDDSWTATSTTNVPFARSGHTAVWTGSEMIVWAGANAPNNGGRYNPSTDSWTATSTTNAPVARASHTAVWTGTEMIVWGGSNFGASFNTGGRYNPATDSWTATNTTNAPTARNAHTAVWADSEMIVWGGFDGVNSFNTGGRYDPSTDSWTDTTTINTPTERYGHTAVWTGNEMIVWGGQDTSFNYPNTGGRYNPSTDSWTATTTTSAPTGRSGHTAVWTHSEMIVWAGSYSNTGGRYNPSTDSWMATTTTSAPTARSGATAVWTEKEMIVWGGLNARSLKLNTGGRYNPANDSWAATSINNAPTERSGHTAVWTESKMIVWGGFNNTGWLNTGGRYCAEALQPFTLGAEKRKVQGINTVRLSWSGATSTDIDIYRDGILIGTTRNDVGSPGTELEFAL